MSFSLGIVGLPNVGKSTLFKALTKKPVLIANYPFATIDPNVGVVEVPDERLSRIVEVSRSAKIIPTAIEFYDIAGLVRGAYNGEGLGNQFLSHIREVNAIAQVVRAFSDPNVSHIHGTADPQNDIEIINLELMMADLQTINKSYKEVSAKAKSGHLGELLGRLKDGLNQGKPAREIIVNDEEKMMARDLHLLTLKPVLYVFNVDEAEALSQAPGLVQPSVAICAKLEAELTELPEAEAKEMREGLGMKESGLDQFIKASYQLLDLITFFTFNQKETRAWTVKRGAKAPQAAGVIHSDFERGFIRAEVCRWEDFVKYGGEAGVKEKGLWRLEGKEYVIQDGDVCYFRSAV